MYSVTVVGVTPFVHPVTGHVAVAIAVTRLTPLVRIPEVTVAKTIETTIDVCCVVVAIESVTLVYPEGIVTVGEVNNVEIVSVIPDVGIGVGATPPEP